MTPAREMTELDVDDLHPGIEMSTAQIARYLKREKRQKPDFTRKKKKLVYESGGENQS